MKGFTAGQSTDVLSGSFVRITRRNGERMTTWQMQELRR